MRAHGTRSAYIGGCKCDECRAAHCAYVKAWRKGANLNVGVDAAPYRKLFYAAYINGSTVSEICEVTGLATDTVRRILYSTPKYIWPQTAKKARKLTELFP